MLVVLFDSFGYGRVEIEEAPSIPPRPFRAAPNSRGKGRPTSSLPHTATPSARFLLARGHRRQPPHRQRFREPPPLEIGLVHRTRAAAPVELASAALAREGLTCR